MAAFPTARTAHPRAEQPRDGLSWVDIAAADINSASLPHCALDDFHEMRRKFTVTSVSLSVGFGQPAEKLLQMG